MTTNQENGWCAIHHITHDVIDRDLRLLKLVQRMDARGADKMSYVLCKNFNRPIPYRDDLKLRNDHRAFLEKHRHPSELREFDRLMSLPAFSYVSTPEDWPITRQRQITLWLNRKGRQLKALLSA